MNRTAEQREAQRWCGDGESTAAQHKTPLVHNGMSEDTTLFPLLSSGLV